jgi:hypothetical protein
VTLYVLLLYGGDKSNQVKDIAKAQEYWHSYKLAKAKDDEAKPKEEK